MTQKTFSNLFPPVTTLAEAKKTSRQGYWAALIVAGMTTALTIAAISTGGSVLDLPIDAWSFIDVGIFVAVAVGIYRHSRIAAVAGLVVYLLGQVYLWTTMGPQGGGWLVGILITLSFINGIRGTFAYHRLRPKATADSVEPVTEN
jgi:hypothetical protein